MVRNSLHVIENSKNSELAYTYIDTALSNEVQAQMAASPNFLAPTNKSVEFSSELQKIAENNEELAKLTLIDWKTLNPQRSALIERFNKDIRI